MYIKDISWVQLDVTKDSIDLLNNLNLDRLYFYRKNMQAPDYGFDSRYDISRLNDIMFSIGYKLIRVKDMIGFERLLYVWNNEAFFPIKEAHTVLSFLIKELCMHIRGLAHSGSNWLHMAMNSENGEVIEKTLSLQHQLPNGTYVNHDLETKKTLVKVENSLTENDRQALVAYDKDFDYFFKTYDYAVTVLHFS